MSVFSDLWLDFSADAPQINQSRWSSVKGQFLYYSSCKNSVWTHIFNYTDTLHSDDFILFTSAKVVLDRRPQNTSSKNNAPCVLLLLMPACLFLNIYCLVPVCFLGFVDSSSSSSVSCSHLSQTASNLPYRQMANFRKVSMQSRCSLVVQTFLTNQDWPCTLGPEMAWNMQMSTNDNPASTLYDRLRWQQTCIVHVVISLLSGNSVSLFWEIWGVLSYSQPISILTQANTDR